MKSYPIWMNITSCIYKASKSYGVKNDGLTQVFVGSSAANSHHFADIRITHREHGEGRRSFRLYLDGQVVKEGIVDNGALSVCSVSEDFPVAQLETLSA